MKWTNKSPQWSSCFPRNLTSYKVKFSHLLITSGLLEDGQIFVIFLVYSPKLYSHM